MALLLTEGFDWLQTSDVAGGGNFGAFVLGATVQSPTLTIEVSTRVSSGAPAGNSIKAIATVTADDEQLYNPQGIAVPISIGTGDEVIFGVAFKFDDVTDGVNTLICGVSNDQRTGPGSSSFAFSIYRDSSDLIAVTYAGGTSTGSTTIVQGQWYYLEFKGIIHNSAGYFVMNLDGVEELNVSGIDTRRSNNADWGAVYLGPNLPSATAPEIQYDDFYLCDDTGGAFDDFLGPIKISILMPNGNGTTSDWLGSDLDSTDNFEMIDETPVDTDTTYVFSDTQDEKDLYTFEDTAEATILAVNHKVVARHADPAARNFVPVVRSATTEVDGSVCPINVSWLVCPTIYEQDPDASAAWTTSTLNAAQFGQKVA